MVMSVCLNMKILKVMVWMHLCVPMVLAVLISHVYSVNRTIKALTENYADIKPDAIDCFFLGKPSRNKKNVAKKTVLKQKNPQKTRKRMEKRIKNKPMNLKMFGVNSAGIKCKLNSLNNILNRLKPQIWSVQETKLRNNEVLECEAVKRYQVFYLYRQNSPGGGLAIEIERDLALITAYGPQENALKEKKEKKWRFWKRRLSKLS